MIETHDLTKRFDSRKQGPVLAVDRLNLRCAAGEVYALLGPNGAGKTTALRVLSTLIEPTSGGATINGLDVRTEKRAIRELIGVVSYETGVYDRMTPREIGYDPVEKRVGPRAPYGYRGPGIQVAPVETAEHSHQRR